VHLYARHVHYCCIKFALLYSAYSSLRKIVMTHSLVYVVDQYSITFEICYIYDISLFIFVTLSMELINWKPHALKCHVKNFVLVVRVFDASWLYKVYVLFMLRYSLYDEYYSYLIFFLYFILCNVSCEIHFFLEGYIRWPGNTKF